MPLKTTFTSLLLLLAGCGLLSASDEPAETYVTAILNGAQQITTDQPSSYTGAAYFEDESIMFGGHFNNNDNSHYATDISIVIPPNLNPLKHNNLYVHEENYRNSKFTERHGDAIVDFYRLYDEPGSHVTIARFDSTTGIMEGAFRLTFTATRPGPRAGKRLPDTLRLTDGRFRVEVKGAPGGPPLD